MRKYRRIILLISILFFNLAAGCSREKTAEKPKEIVIKIWVNYNNEEITVFQELMDELKEQLNRERDVPVSFEIGRVPFEGLLPTLKTACQSGTTPDICRVDCAHVVPLACGQAVYALDELDNFSYSSIDSLREKFVAAAFDSNVVEIKNKNGEWEKHLFGLPDQTTCVALYWNRAMFRARAAELKKKGLSPDRAPKTWEEFIEYGKVLTVPERKEYAFGMRNSLWWTFPFFNTFGADFVQTDNQGKKICVLNSKKAVDALKFKVDLYNRIYQVNGKEIRLEAGAWQSGAINPDQGFINEKYAMILSGPWMLETFKQAGIDFGVSLIPAGPAGTSSNVGGTNLVIFRSCKYPELAFRVLEYITSAQYQLKWCMALRQIPVNKETYRMMGETGDENFRVFMEQMLSARARPRLPLYDKLETIINPEMELALNGTKTPEQALDDAVRRINDEIMSLINE